MHISRTIQIADVLLLGVLLFLSGCSTPSKPHLSTTVQAAALSHFSLGLLAETGGDSAAALNHFESAIKLDPNEEKLYVPAVALALKLNRTNDAIRLAQKLAKRHDDTINPLLLLARVYAVTKQPDQAEPLFKKALLKFPDNPETPVYLARFYLAEERRAEAIATLRTVLKTQTKNAELIHILGTLCIDSARDLGNTPQAKAAIEEGIVLLQQALAIFPDDPRRWQQLGFALMAVQKPVEALEAFKVARQQAPADLLTARQNLDLLIATGKTDEAMQVYEQMAQDTGTEPEAWIQYLAEKLSKEDQNRLISYLETQISENPAQAPIFYYAQLGALYINAKNNQAAEKILLEALRYYPDNSRLRTVQGYLHLQQERYDEAYTAFKRVRTESPAAEWSANPFFLFNFLISAQKSGHLDEAAETLASTYTENPVILNQYMHSLLTGQTSVSTDGAIELMTVFRTLNHEAAEALYYLMVLQAEKKEYEKAIETAQQFEVMVLKSGATNLLSEMFYYQYAILYERTGQLEPAEKKFLKVIDLNGTMAASAQNYVAYMWAEHGEKLDDGLALIQQALAANPENGAFMDTLGWIYYKQGRYAEALKVLQKACLLTETEDDSTVWEHLGDIQIKLGNRDEASKHWKKALELDPGSQKLIERLESIGVKIDAIQQPADCPADTMPRP